MPRSRRRPPLAQGRRRASLQPLLLHTFLAQYCHSAPARHPLYNCDRSRPALWEGTAKPSAFEIRLAYLCVRQYTRSARSHAD